MDISDFLSAAMLRKWNTNNCIMEKALRSPKSRSIKSDYKFVAYAARLDEGATHRVQHTKRGRNQRRRPGGGSNPNRSLDSNGPEVRIRGTANQIYDKYIALARDASSSGDRIKAESYLQHAEHYFRMIKATQQTQQNQQAQRNPQHQKPSDGHSDQPNVGGGEAASTPQQSESREPGNGDGEPVDKPATEPEQTSTDSVESTATSGTSEETVKKPRRRTRRPTRSAENDDAAKSSEDAETATAAAE